MAQAKVITEQELKRAPDGQAIADDRRRANCGALPHDSKIWITFQLPSPCTTALIKQKKAVIWGNSTLALVQRVEFSRNFDLTILSRFEPQPIGRPD